MQKVFTKRERLILFLTICVFFFSIGFNLLFAPILNKNENLNKGITLTRLKLKKYLQLLSQKDYIQNKHKELSGGLKEFKGKDVFVNTLSELEILAKESGIRIIDIRPETPRSPGLYKEILVSLRAEGTMEAYLKFIYNVENSLSLLRIPRFQLNAKANSQLLEGSFSISRPASE